MKNKQYEDKLASLASHSSSSADIMAPAPVATRSVGVNTPPVAVAKEELSTRDRGVALAFNTMSRYLIKSKGMWIDIQ
jgi:hypothetical protein